MENSESSVILVDFKFRRCVNHSIKNIIESKLECIQSISFSYEETRLFKNSTECSFELTGKKTKFPAILDELYHALKKEMNAEIKYGYTFKNGMTKMGPKINSGNTSSNPVGNSSIRSQNDDNVTPLRNKCFSFKHREEVEKLERRLEKFLQCHDDKIEKLQVTLNNLPRDSSSVLIKAKDDEEKNILLQKLEELRLQRTEFVKRCNHLMEKFKSLDRPKAGKSYDLDAVQKQIGIECRRLEKALPIYARRDDIVRKVQSNQVSVILGETGSGKSTQLVQYLYEAGFASEGLIVCTQPRRLAALSLAEHVSQEMVEFMGNTIGYKAGIKKKCNENTKVFFTTDHSLLNECLNDRSLSSYSCIIIDEAHERSIYTDILLGIIKMCISRRPDLKVIITSATIDPEVFINYFNSGPELRVSGRTFPVEVYYANEGEGDFEKYEEKAVARAFEIHCSEDPGDILVFLTTPAEIMRCCEEFEKRCKACKLQNFKCLPLHGQLTQEEQKQVFESFAKLRKIVFATNCAETSITIDGIKHVVDTGVAKEMKFDPKRNMNQLGIHAISQSSANQRKGRAGRTASGKCYRLYSEAGFKEMSSISDPEILRVHLGQAILKIAELGIDVKMYDFVQAPSQVALNSAIENLVYLGALINGRITNIGKWLSKLPFDPKLSYIVYHAEQLDLLYDAVVLSSVISSGSDIFFRGFTESEAQVVEKSKMFFGSNFGDTFTWLNIYKAWCSVDKNEKKKWCRSHCINNKCITFIHQSIKDVKEILSNGLGIDLIENFSSASDALNSLRKILCSAMADTISNFSDVSRAGYYTLISERQVNIHPSSILAALNLEPEWIVYSSLIRTSREFVKGTTVVEEEWIRELIEDGKLDLDLEKAKGNKYVLVHQEETGPTVFNALVGPRFSNLPILEGDLVQAGVARFSLEVKKDFGILNIFSPFPICQSVIDKFCELKSPITEKLLLEDYEFKFNNNDSFITSASGIRVVLGCGGSVKKILMPDESDKVLIFSPHESVTEEELITKFETFGEIREIVQFKSLNPWGFVKYGSYAEARSAVEATHKDQYNAGILKIDKQHNKQVKNMFEARLSWVRRPIKGYGTAFIKCNPCDQALLIGSELNIDGKYFLLKASRRGDLMMHKTGSLTEKKILDEFKQFLTIKGISTDGIKVDVPREDVPLSVNDLKEKRDIIISFLRDRVLLSEDSFTVHILQPKHQRSIYHVCFLGFTNPVKGFEACKKMGHSLFIGGESVDVNPCLKTSVHVPRQLKTACEEQFKSLFAGCSKYKTTELTWIKRKTDFAIEIKSSEPANLVEVRDLLCKEMDGYIIDCSLNNTCASLLNPAGQTHLKLKEKENECTVMTDFRNRKLHLYGSQENITKMLQDVNSFLDEVEGSEQRLLLMKGHNKPAGFMKLIMQKYGPKLDGLLDRFNLKNVNIDWKKHSVTLVGSNTNIEEACKALFTLEQTAWGIQSAKRVTSLPDCSVCLCPVEDTQSLVRLELCGHAYCTECFKHQVSYTVDNRDFPLTCAGESCSSPFVWKDIRFALSRQFIQERKLVSMAVSSFVQANPTLYKFCLTPNCDVVYEVTEDGKGHEFTCPLCFSSICTSCHIPFHAGLTCVMAQSGAKAESELSSWVADDSVSRKLCPGCQSPIEKIEGCNKMHCSGCHKVFCWLCLEVFQSEDQCYKHLRNFHDGYY